MSTYRENTRVPPLDASQQAEDPALEQPDGFHWPIWIWFIAGLAFWAGLFWWAGLVAPAGRWGLW